MTFSRPKHDNSIGGSQFQYRKETHEREMRTLLRASAALSCDNLLVLTAEEHGEQEVEWHGTRRTIRVLPLWRWLVGIEEG